MLKKALIYTVFLTIFSANVRGESVTSTKTDVASRFITLYQSGAANIIETRNIRSLKKGMNTVYLTDLLNQYDENLMVDASALSSLSIPTGDFTLDSLRRFEGQEVAFLPKEKGMLTKPREGKLLKVLGDDRFIMEFKSGVEVGVEGNLILRREDFARAMPNFTLNAGGGDESIGLNYNANGLSWRPIYRLFLDEEGRGSLTAEALIQSNLEHDVKNAIVTLASGSGMVLAESLPQPRLKAFAFASPMEDSALALPAGEILNKWAFQIPGVVNLQANATGKFKMLDSIAVKGTRMKAFESYVGKYPAPNRDIPFKPAEYVKFENNTSLGLPNGSVKVYEAKTKKFVAEDRMPDAASGQEVKIRLGEALDINLSRAQKSFAVNDAKEYVMEFEIKVNNLSSSLQEVLIIENFDGQFDIKKSNKKYTVKGQAAEWQITVARGGVETLIYQVILK